MMQDPIIGQLKAWGYGDINPAMINAPARLLAGIKRTQARRIEENADAAKNDVRSGHMSRPEALIKTREFRELMKAQSNWLEHALKQSAVMIQDGKRYSERQGFGVDQTIIVPELPSERRNVPASLSDAAQVMERVGQEGAVEFKSATLPRSRETGVSSISPIPSMPSQNYRESVEWLDKSRNSWATASEIEYARDSGDFYNIIAIDRDTDRLLFPNPPATYEGPTGIIDLDGVKTAILFDEQANPYYVPVGDDQTLIVYMGGGRRIPWLALGLVGAAALLLVSKR